VELEDVEMRMPSVVLFRLSAMGDLKRTNLADVTHLSHNGLDFPITQEALQCLALLFQELGEVVAALMGCGEGQKGHRATLCPVNVHGLEQFNPATLCDLGGADRARPNAATGLQTAIAGRVVFLGLPDLNVCASSAQP
jgi:hypothetical protein